MSTRLAREPFGVASERQSTALRIARLVLTATAAYVLADMLREGGPAPLLAPLTALLVVQYSLYETIKSGIGRILAVTSGVLVAVLFGHTVGFSWWSLSLTILAALVIGTVLRLGDHLLEVPISAMLIFALGAASGGAAADRVLETLIGAGTGLAVTVLVPSVRIRPAQDAVENLGGRLATLVGTMSGTLNNGIEPDSTSHWRSSTEQLFRDISRTDEALGEAEQSVRLNPRALRVVDAGVALRNGVETLEHFAVSLRGLTRALNDVAHLAPEARVLQRPEISDPLASTLAEVATSVAIYARLARSDVARDAVPAELEAELAASIAAAARHRDVVAERLREAAAGDVSWPLYGEILSHLDRLIDDVRVEHRTRAREVWRRERGAARHLPERPAQVVNRAGDQLRRAARAAADAAEQNASAAEVGATPYRPRTTAHSHHPPERARGGH
ncbi:FUSC family protein [Actinomadura flavalba]|uniref:FUSC family protein n=1 Tax=Actinomadura flavalba TaxID=1120938 RepID=UPI000380D651|nr:aromatic acid exporter family protein [Actinomadura flavalba]